jgi:signal transduction histidine kinase
VAERDADENRRLLDAMLLVASDLSLPDVLRRIVEAGCQLADARYGALGVIGAGGELAQFTHVGVDDDTVARIGHLPTGKGLLGHIIEQPAPLRTDDLHHHPASSGFPASHPQMTSFLGVPIRVRGEVFGNLYLTEKLGGGGFTQQDQDTVTALAAAAGVAIHNARLYARSHQREQWLRATNEITSALRTGPVTREVLLEMATLARQSAGAELGFVALPDETGESLVIEAADGGLAEALTGLSLQLVDSFTGDVYSTGRPKVLELLPESALDRSVQTFNRLPNEIKGLGPAVFVALSAAQRPVGVLMIARERGASPFDEEEVAVMAAFAGQAGLAIEAGRAQHELAKLAVYEERDRIARDLHDLVIQRLFAIGLGVQGLSRTITGPVAVERLAGYVGEIDQTIRDIRRTIFSLQQPPGESHSLRGEVLRVISEATGSLGFEPTVRLEGPLDSVVPADVQPDLLATLREALSNVVRHAAARSALVTVSVGSRASMLALEVADDGCGLPSKLTHRSGLANMSERARRWGGTCTVTSDLGTHVEWEVPLSTRPRQIGVPLWGLEA